MAYQKKSSNDLHNGQNGESEQKKDSPSHILPHIKVSNEECDKKDLDVFYMRLALEQAKRAAECGEVPVGAVIARREVSAEANEKLEILAEEWNKIEQLNSAAAHAEILAINAAGKKLKNWRLNSATLYVTMEPCPMCWGAIRNSRISRVVFAAKDTREECGAGEATENAKNFIEVESGLLEKESVELLKEFFRAARLRVKRNGDFSIP